MIKKEFKIVNKLGFHARAAVQFVQLANQFISDVKVQKDNVVVCGKSIMGVLMLAASKGSVVSLIVEGNDEKEAIEKLGEMINNGFGEES